MSRGILASVSVVLSAAVLAGCAEYRGEHEIIPVSPETIRADQANDKQVLAGEWEYEDGAVVTLRLDEEGNGSYGWKNGRLTTTGLHDRTWVGVWSQSENDREGGFEVILSPDYTEGEGRWWYTRIGSDESPSRKGGTFHLTRILMNAGAAEDPDPSTHPSAKD